MIGYLIRWVLWAIGSIFRRMRTPSDYITFLIKGRYPELSPPPRNPIQRRLTPSPESLQDLAEKFRRVARDDRVRGVVLNMRPLTVASAQLDTLRDLVIELREAGKHVVVWTNIMDRGMYYVASAADEILMQPGARVDPFGMSSRYLFLADALDSVGLDADFVAITPYKSAGDMFQRRDMSDEVRQMANWLADSVYGNLIDAIAEGRGISAEEARTLVDNTPCTDQQALEMGLIDKLLHEEDLPTYLQQGDEPATLGGYESAPLRRKPPTRPGKYVALLTVEGLIIDGTSTRPPIRPPVPGLGAQTGDITFVQEVRRVMADKRAAAVVLYINSRGGSAIASEAMAAALEKLAAEKPLIVAMGPVAASGGYYVAAPGEKIFAQPNTLTGSIGVIAGKLHTDGLLDMLNINRETLTRGDHALILSPDRGFTEEERGIIRDLITRTYDLFLDRVQQGRGISRDDLLDVAGGRVWTGEQAHTHNLVDEMGSVETAIAEARQRADLRADSAVRRYQVSDDTLIPPRAEEAAAYIRQMASTLQGTLCLLPLIGGEDWL